VPVFGPPIHEGATFTKSKAFSEFLLAKGKLQGLVGQVRTLYIIVNELVLLQLNRFCYTFICITVFVLLRSVF
jgi:hypothetical protein